MNIDNDHSRCTCHWKGSLCMHFILLVSALRKRSENGWEWPTWGFSQALLAIAIALSVATCRVTSGTAQGLESLVICRLESWNYLEETVDRNKCCCHHLQSNQTPPASPKADRHLIRARVDLSSAPVSSRPLPLGPTALLLCFSPSSVFRMLFLLSPISPFLAQLSLHFPSLLLLSSLPKCLSHSSSGVRVNPTL